MEAALDQKASVVDVNAILARKADIDTMNGVLATKPSRGYTPVLCGGRMAPWLSRVGDVRRVLTPVLYLSGCTFSVYVCVCACG